MPAGRNAVSRPPLLARRKLLYGALLGTAVIILVSTQVAVGEDNNLKDGAKSAGHALGSAAREVGQGAKKAGKTVGQAAKEGGREFRRALKGQSKTSD